MEQRSVFSPKDVFLSWNNKDRARKDQLVSWLEGDGISVWESDFECNGAIEDVCLGHVPLCKVFVILLTERSVQSLWVKKELDAAMRMEDSVHRIVPVIMSRDILDKKQYGVMADSLRALFDNPDDRRNVSAIIAEGMEPAELERKLIKNVRDLCLNRCYDAYVRNLSRAHFSLPILVNVGTVSASGDLRQLYIPRSLKRAVASAGDRELTEAEFLAEPGHAVIVGSGGSGKSQYLTNMAAMACRDNRKLVFLVSCAELARARGPLTEHLFREFSQVVGDVHYERRHFDGLMAHRKEDILLLLDGLDEVISDEAYEQLRKNAERFLDVYPQARLVFTSRNRRDASRMVLNARTAEAFYLERFSEADIQRYARQLFMAFSDPERGEQFYIDLASIDEEIKGNPLLVSQLAVIYADSGKLPGTVVEIFDVITELVTTAIDTRHDFMEDLTEKERSLTRRLPEILRELSYRKYCKYAEAESADNLGLLCDILERYGEPKAQCRVMAVKLLNYLERRAILYRAEFAHKMFLEYFTAVYLYESCFDGSGSIRDASMLEHYISCHYHESYWQTVTELLLTKVDCLGSRESLERLYAVACTVCRGDYDLLFQVLRIQRRRELISGLLLTDILRRTLSGEYGAYAQLFCYVPRENLYREAVNAIAALWGRLEEGERFAALSLLRDVCFIYGGYARLETLTDRLTLRQFQLFARKRDKSPRAALNALFCGVSPAWLEAYLADQAGSRVYPAFFNVHAVAAVGPGCFGQYPLDQVFADELGLYGQTEPDDDGLYRGLVSLPYEKDWLEAELTADFAGAMTGLVLLPSQEPVFEQLSIANTRLMLLALPSTIRELGRQSLAYYGIHGQWGYRLLMEHGPEKLERDHGIRYGGAMESLTLPASIRVIGEAAFQGDDRLERLTLLSGVAAIGERAFSDCVRLRSISLPDTVTELGERLFAHCSGLTHVTIGSGVKTLPDFAFWGCRRLESVILPESLTQIGAHAFSGCESLKSVQLPPNLRVIGSYAFHGCGGLTEIRIPGSLRFLGNGAFEDCAGLTTAYLPGGLRVIDEDTFCGCVNLESVTLGDGIRKIGQGAFARCEALRQTVLPESLTEIGQYAFKNCLSLEQISLPQGLTDIGIEAFSGCEKLRCAEIPGGIRVIQSAAFAGCTALEELKLNPGLAEIWEMAFTSCSSLRSVHIPETVTEIGNAAFYGCGALQTIQVPAKTGVGTDAFAGCPGAAETYDPLEDDITLLFGSHEACEAYRESQETNEEIVIDGSMCPGGVLDRENATRLLPRMRFFRLRIGDGIHTIDNGALEQAAGFRERLCVTEVILSDSVKRIGTGAFQNCEHLTRAVLPRDLEEIPDGLFCGCRGLQTVILPDRVPRIGMAAFADCMALTELELPDSLNLIGDNAFSGAGLTDVAVPERVTQIGSGAFSECAQLRRVTLPPSVKLISDGCFRECPELISVSLPAGLEEIGQQAFGYCEKLRDIAIPKSVTMLSKGAFLGCGALETADIPAGTARIGAYAFHGCGNLTGLTIGYGVREIGDSAFGQCEKLEDLMIPGSVALIGEGAFAQCDSLRTVRILPGVERIGGFAFQLCERLSEIQLPDTVTGLGEAAFMGCKSLVKLQLPAALREIPEMLLIETGLRELEIPQNVTFIAPSAFRECPLRRVVLPERFRDKLRTVFDDFRELRMLDDDRYLEILF